MVDNECDDLFEEYKADEEFDASDVMDTPLRKAMIDFKRIIFTSSHSSVVFLFPS
jgi:hypothetical protein